MGYKRTHMRVKNKLSKNSYLRLSGLLIFILGLFFNSCKESPNDLSIGEKYIESQTNMTLVDTFSVNLSTVILDTVLTSGTGDILIGSYKDNTFGKVMCSSYFPLGTSDSTDLYDTGDIYDSLNLVIHYNGYYYGDTTKTQKFSVHQLTESIKLGTDETITSNTTFNYSSSSIGSLVYTPQPHNEIDTLAIRISDNLGTTLFNMIKSDSEVLESDEAFVNYFHGLVFVPDNSYSGAVIGFDIHNLELRLYTTRKEDSGTETITYRFGISDSTKQFNNIKKDFSSTQLSSLTEQRYKLSSASANGLTYLQGGSGLTIRVDFPSLQELLLRDRGTIVKAQLVICPLENSYSEFELPEQLYMYQASELNRVDLSGSYYALSTLTIDKLYDEGTNYTFDITDLLNAELSDSYIDPEDGFLITLPYSYQMSTFDRLIINAKSVNTKLKIYYLSY